MGKFGGGEMWRLSKVSTSEYPYYWGEEND